MNEATTEGPADVGVRPTVIRLRPGASSSLKEITVIGPPRGGKPKEITLLTKNHHYPSYIKVPERCIDPITQYPVPLQASVPRPDSAVLLNSKKIPRPPNAFMIFANEWRKQLATQHPTESNKSISVRLGHLWKNMSKPSKDVYYQRSRQAGQDHKQKYPGYVYNPKEARMRKALREQSRGSRSGSGGVPTRWTKHALTMNLQRQSLVSPVLLLPQQRCTDDSKVLLEEHQLVDQDNNMLQSYPDYLDLPYNIPSCDFPLDPQPWYPYLQPGVQSNGPLMGRGAENKLPVDWSTPYNSEQGNFIRASPQSSPYSIQNNQEVNGLMLNGDRSHAEQTTEADTCLASVADLKPDITCPPTDNSVAVPAIVKDPEQQVKELLASAQVISEGSPMVNGTGTAKQEDSNSTRLPGFHQAFGSTEIGRFSQPDGFFEAAVAAENERKTPEVTEFTYLSFSPGPAWTSSFFSFPSKPEPDLFGFQEQDCCDYFPPSGVVYSAEQSYDPGQQHQALVDTSIVKQENPVGCEEFEPQDLSAFTNISKPPVIISQNDNCCVVLESSAMDNDVKEYFSL